MNLIQRLSSIQELPTLPEVALRIRALVISEEGDASMLSRIIEQDPSLSSKILKVANSSFYCSAGRRINSIKNAITRIGFNQIGNISMAVCLIRQFSRKSNILNYKQFWKHSLSAAFLTSLVHDTSSETSLNNEKQSIFLSGLLHDIGILIYDQFFHEEFEKIIDYAMQKEISYHEAELELFPNETHAAIGSAFLEMWKLDSSVISSIRYHHSPEKAPENFRPYVFVTYLTEYILCNSSLGTFEGMVVPGNKQVLNALSLTPDMIESFLKLAQYEVERSDLIMALESDNSTLQLRTV